MGLSLLDSVYLDVRDSLLIEGKLSGIKSGVYKGGSGPTINDLKRRRTEKDVIHGKRLALDIIDSGVSLDIDLNESQINNRGMLETRLKQVKRSMRIRQEFNDGQMVRRYKVSSGPKGTKSFMVRIGNYPSCTCNDFEKQGKKVKCKHILFVLLHCLSVQVDSNLLKKSYFGDDEVKSIFDNAPSSVPSEFLIPTLAQKKDYNAILSTEKEPEQIWSLVKKTKRSAKCRNCKKEINVDHYALQAKGALVVPFNEEKAVERTQYFCPKKQCISRFPPWTNLLRPLVIKADDNVSEKQLEELEKEIEMPIDRSTFD